MSTVRGRFAPTPSGPLHFGSLVAALASAVDARAQGGEWLLRIDDLDRAREAAGARVSILEDLSAHGFAWDGKTQFQHPRNATYHSGVTRLLESGRAYPCACTRSEIAALSPDGLYPGTCRQGIPAGKTARSVRLHVPDTAIEFEDRWAGRVTRNLAREVGDFVLWRADGVAAYHLATVLDDAEAGVTHVVRGADLLDSTPRQIFLQRILGLPTPRYAHFPLVVENGRKLGKQTHAPRLDRHRPVRTLAKALEFLHQRPPRSLKAAALDNVWNWALENWRPENLRQARANHV
jgi:glutamyl-Q tRNA(Asp) synthetase